MTPIYPFVVEVDPEAGFHIRFPDLPGCMSDAENWEDIGPMAHEALQLWLATAAEHGLPIPEQTWGTLTQTEWTRSQRVHPTAVLSSVDVAVELGITPRRVAALARSRGVGKRLGVRYVFSPADVEALRVRQPGRPRGH